MSSVTHAQIEPTTRCNFTCGFCAGRAMTQQNLAWDAFAAFLDAHPDLRRVELQGEAEPLLHKRFFDMVAERALRGIAVGLITNGSLLDETTAARLLASGIDSIHISLESADPATFQTIRGGKFAKVREGMARLVAGRAALGSARPVIGLTVTVLKSTLGAMAAILDLYEREGLDGGIVLQPLQSMPVYSGSYAPEMLAELIPAALMPRFAELRRIAALRAPVRGSRDFFYFDLFAGFDPRRATCPWLDHGAYLTAGGLITGCCFMKDEGAAFGSALAGAARADAVRTDLAAALDRGQLPQPCAGCGTAASILRARQVRVTA